MRSVRLFVINAQLMALLRMAVQRQVRGADTCTRGVGFAHIWIKLR